MTSQATQALQADTGQSGATLTYAYASGTIVSANNAVTTASTPQTVVLLGANDTLNASANVTVAALGASDTIISTALKVNFIPMGTNETLIEQTAGATIYVDPTQALHARTVAQIDASHDTIIFKDLADVLGNAWSSWWGGYGCGSQNGGGQSCGTQGYCPVAYTTTSSGASGYASVACVPQCGGLSTSGNQASNVAAVLVVGDNNLIQTGAVSSVLGVDGHFNVITGGACDTSVTLTGVAAAANVVIGGAGATTLVSTAVATKVIGGSGSMTATVTADAATIIGGAGCLNAAVTGNGGDYQTGSGTARITVNGFGGVFATGAGTSAITANGGGALLYEAAEGGAATFNVNGTGMSVYGGDTVNANGNGNTVHTRGQITGAYPASYLKFLFTSGIGSFLPDANIAAALAATGASFLPDGVTALTTTVANTANSYSGCGGWGCGGWGWGGWGCGPAPVPPRLINFNGDGGAVYSGDRITIVNLTGNNNSIYAGAIAQTVTIGSGSGNGVYAGLGGGNNVYDGGPGSNYLDYQASPVAVTVNLLTGRAINALGGTDTIRNLNIVDAGAGSTLIAGPANATLTVHGDNGVMKGGAGNDALHGTGNNDVFYTGAGNDTVTADGTGAVYNVASATAGTTLIDQASVGISGTLSFANVAQPTQLWFEQDAANDLVVTILGTAKTTTFEHWFATDGTGTQLAKIGATGAYLDNAGVNAVQQAMATYQSSHAGFNAQTASALPTDSGIASAFATYLHAA